MIEIAKKGERRGAAKQIVDGVRLILGVGIIALPLTLAAVERTVTATVKRNADGIAESVDLVFGECAEDFVGKLYVAYGDSEGSSTAYGWKHFKLINDAVTAETTTCNYPLPEGWGQSNLFLRFFLGVYTATIHSAKDYYVQDGLVAMFDGVDNAGNGAHDAKATSWTDLVSGQPFAWNNSASWVNKNSLQLDAVNACFPFSLSGPGRLWTLQMTLLSKGGGGTFLDSKNDSVWCKFNDSLKFSWRNETRPSTGDWKSQTETLTIVSDENWYGVHFASCTGWGNWNKVEDELADSKSLNETVCFGGGAGLVGGNDGTSVGVQAACIRLYNKALSDADILANNAVDAIRFYGGDGSLPAIGESGFSVMGVSDTIKADPFVAIASFELLESTELAQKVSFCIGGHEIGSRSFNVYAVLDGGSKQLIQSSAVPGSTYTAIITGLEPQRDYTISIYAKDVDSDLATPMSPALVAKTKTPVLNCGRTVDGGREVMVMNRLMTNGVISAVRLSFGECADDWQGDLYMGYGANSGMDMQRGYWEQFVKLNDAPLTAADKVFTAEVPEGWHSSVWCMRFFLESSTGRFVNAADYYVTDGLIAMFDALDNAGTGVHDADFGYWADLTTHGYDIKIAPYIGSQLNGWTDNSLSASSLHSVPLYKNCFDYKTIEIAARYDGKYQALFWAGNSGEGKAVITGCNGNNVQFNIGSSLYPINDPTFLYGSCVYSSPNSSPNQVYIKGKLAEGNGGDHWGSAKSDATGLGMGYNGVSKYNFTGEYYVIRLYDRELTAVEVAHNYLIDSIRYGGAEGELKPLANTRKLITSSTRTIFGRETRIGLTVIVR